jgi:hypothetical protein
MAAITLGVNHRTVGATKPKKVKRRIQRKDPLQKEMTTHHRQKKMAQDTIFSMKPWRSVAKELSYYCLLAAEV